MLIVKVMNAPDHREDYLQAIKEACLGTGDFRVEANELIAKCSRHPAHTWGDAMIVVRVDVCFPADGLTEGARRRLARAITTSVKKVKSARHMRVKTIIRNFPPEQIVIDYAPPTPARQTRRRNRR